MGTHVGAGVFVHGCKVAHAQSAGDDEESDRIHVARLNGPHEVGQAEMLAAVLAREREALNQRGGVVRVVDEHRIAFGLCRKVAAHGVRANQMGVYHLLKHRVDALFHGDGLGVSLHEAFLHVAVQAHVLAVEHLRVQIGPQIVERQVAEHQALERRDAGPRHVGTHR